jgi:hypothetical protein
MADFDQIKNDATAKAEDIADKAKSFIDDNKDKIADAVKSDKVEEVTDKMIHGLADGLKKVTGGKFDEQIDKAADNVDKHVGSE